MNGSKSPRSFISDSVRNIPKSGIRDFFDVVSSMPDTVSLGVGEPGFQTPWHIRDMSIYALEKGATGYTSNLGLLELRQTLARYAGEFFGIPYSPQDEILVTTGVSEAVDLALRAIIDPGDEIVYHEPCYVSYRPVIQLAHGVPVVAETRFEDNFRLTADAIEAQITPRTKALMLNFPNNPTGAVLSSQDLQDIADLARGHDLLVITDEIYAELSYEESHREYCRPARNAGENDSSPWLFQSLGDDRLSTRLRVWSERPDQCHDDDSPVHHAVRTDPESGCGRGGNQAGRERCLRLAGTCSVGTGTSWSTRSTRWSCPWSIPVVPSMPSPTSPNWG